MVNSNVPRSSNLATELHRNYFFKLKLVLSSARSNTHMMAPLCEQITNLFRFNSSSEYGEIVQLQSALNDDYNNVSGKIKHVPYFRANNGKIFSKTCATLFTFEQFSLIHSAFSAMKRCNASQGFGAFFVQSCDRFLFPFYLFSHHPFPVLSRYFFNSG